MSADFARSATVMRASAAENFSSARASAGTTTFASSVEFGSRCVVVIFDRAGRAQDLVGGDIALVARELVAAARSAHAAQDSLAHERLQNRFEMARRKTMPARKRFGSHRLATRIHGDVQDSGNGKDALARQ